MRAVWLLVGWIGCSKATEKPAPDAAGTAPEPAGASTAGAPSTSAKASSVPCGGLGCQAFDDLPSAFAAALADDPLVVAVGEAHAKKAHAGVETSAQRFTREVLPSLGARTGDLLLELMAPAQGCETDKKATQKELGKIGKEQAPSAPNEYVTLGKAAEKAGVKVSQLHPTCKDFAAIAAAKSPPLVVLQTITRLATTDLVAGLARPGRSADKLFLFYGGAFHTEPTPPEERAEFSIAPKVSAAAKGRYASVHLFVREYVDKDWDIWPWYPHFSPGLHPDKVLLYHPKPGHWVIVTAAHKP